MAPYNRRHNQPKTKASWAKIRRIAVKKAPDLGWKVEERGGDIILRR